MRELGCPLGITDAHYGARPSHAVWQGRPFGIDGEVVMDGVRYPSMAELTDYGTAGGLKGVNCRHSINPFWPGITELPDTEFREDRAKHNGMSSDEYYAATQRQRAYERAIRKSKASIAQMERAGIGLESPAYVQERLVLGNRQRQLRSLGSANNMTRQSARERAYGTSSQPRALIGRRWTTPATYVGRSLGAAAKVYEATIPASLTGLEKPIKVKTTEEKWIGKGTLIAGNGHPVKIHDELDSLKSEYPDIPASEWHKMAGKGWVDDLGVSRHVELHWYELVDKSVKYARLKVKKFLKG